MIREYLDKHFSYSLFMYLGEVRDYMFFLSIGMFIIGALLIDKMFGIYLCGIGLMFVTVLTFMMIPMDLLGYGWEYERD